MEAADLGPLVVRPPVPQVLGGGPRCQPSRPVPRLESADGRPHFGPVPAVDLLEHDVDQALEVTDRPPRVHTFTPEGGKQRVRALLPLRTLHGPAHSQDQGGGQG